MDVINRRKVMKKTLKSIVLLGALYGGSLHASFEFRSPLSLEDRGYMHWLLAPADQAWWYDGMPTAKKHTEWNIHMWGAGYTRTASKAFYDKCDPDKITRDTATLSQLFFGKQVFRGEDAFTGGTFESNSPGIVLVNDVNPYIAFARITPNFDYNENGAHMGIDFAKYVGQNDRYHVGGRAYVPFKVIEIEQNTSIEIEETLDDVFVTRIIKLDEGVVPTQVEYAMRYDFLSTLSFNSVTTPSAVTTVVPVVKYNPVPAGSVTVTGVQISGTSVDQAGLGAYLTKSDDGTTPIPPFRRTPEKVDGILGANGQGLDDLTYWMQNSVDYAGNLQNNRDAQATLFLVPRAINNPGQPDDGTITGDARTILTQVQGIIASDLLISEPVSSFFLDNGINLLAYERVVGVGDFATEVYGGVGHYDDWFVDGIFGIQFPTGKRQKCANQIYYKPTGNNGHVEIKLELDAGWKPRPWFAFEIRPRFVHACKRSEKRAAPFTGATIVNIGPEVEVDVSWNYFVLRTDFSFFHPHNRDLGFVLGYELFARGHDNVSLCQTTATDLLGRPDQPLSACNYERNTNSFSNKLRGELFHRWNYFEIFGGGSQMVSGRNIMKETEGHIGLSIYF